MENIEVVDLIAKAKNKKWFDDKIIEVNFVKIDLKYTFNSVMAFYNFINSQVELSKNIEEDNTTPDNLKIQSDNFDNVLAQILFFTSNFYNEEDNLESIWLSNVQPNIDNLRNCITIDSPVFDLLIKLSKTNGESYLGAYNFIFNSDVTFKNRDKFEGALHAYETIEQGKSIITSRSAIERENLGQLKNEFTNTIAKSEVKLTDFIAATNQKYTDYTKEIDEYKTNKKVEVDNWYDETKENFNTFDTDAKKKIEDLEKTYQELLSLKAPADYWDKRATELKTEGKKWLNYLIGSVTIGVIILVTLLIIIASNKFEEIFSFSGKTIRWSILLITLVSFIAYAIRTFTKLTFSTFHLVRDAEERKQLTFVYLSLKENNSVTDAERLLILQSLFSRADTGLLKEDSSPTMPSGIDKLIQR
jgi:uncharacterized integral membrane protein